MKATYSWAVWTSVEGWSVPIQTATGSPRIRLTRALFRLCSQNRPAASGSSAMQSSIATKGRTAQRGSWWPRASARMDAGMRVRG